jgi:hypothetical protein
MTATEMIKEIPPFYGTWSFTAMFTRAHHWILFSASWIHLYCNVYLVFEKYFSLSFAILMSVLVHYSFTKFHCTAFLNLSCRYQLETHYLLLLHCFTTCECFTPPLSADRLNLLISHTFTPAWYIPEPSCWIQVNFRHLSLQSHLGRLRYCSKELCTQHSQLPLLMW